MAGLVKNWLQIVPWETVVSINAALCEARKALHKPMSDGYAPAKELWERNRSRKLSLLEIFQIGFQCHRLAPFCNYNGNTFVTIIKTLLDDVLKGLPADKAHILRSIAATSSPELPPTSNANNWIPCLPIWENSLGEGGARLLTSRSRLRKRFRRVAILSRWRRSNDQPVLV